MLDTFTPVELVWTLIGVVGFLLGMANVKDAMMDKKAIDSMPLTSKKRDDLELMAHASVRMEVLRTSKMAAVVGIGLFAGLTSPPIPPNVHIPTWTPVSLTLTLGLFYIVGVIVLQMFLDRKLRKRFYGRKKD